MCQREQDLIVFDGACLFCSGFARFMARRDQARRFSFVTAQSDLGRQLFEENNLDPDLMETNIVIVDGRAHVKLAAFAAAMATLGPPWAWLGVIRLIPRTPGDWLYDRMARNRYLFGRRSCALPSPQLRAELQDRLIA